MISSSAISSGTKTISHDRPHRRRNPLTGGWVVVSPHRAKRPWQGQVGAVVQSEVLAHDPECYLCAGNKRVSGATNPDYRGPFVFQNDFPALSPQDEKTATIGTELFQAQQVRGEARVICFSERHDLTLAQMDDARLALVVDVWIAQYQELAAKYQWIAIFENKGEMMGCSNPHPHGQIWASDHIPTEIEVEDRHQAKYYARQGRPLLVDYAGAEQEAGARVVSQTDHWLCVVPWWAVWPFETMILPKRHVRDLTGLNQRERADLGPFIGSIMRRYDNLFQTSFPYSMGWHGAPPQAQESDFWQVHAHVYPPLLRSATVRKFMVGYELLAEAQRDLTPEQAAERLNKVGDQHFRKRYAGTST